ncbi:MAG TPA: PAS domain-containing protein, partial [Herpetosiphonaceae bacterium]|nr:PAS domain-containing protein [Herpetosiphonaceae bacterium]
LLSLVITIGIASGIAAWIAQPIRALSESAKAFAAGHWSQSAPRGGGREVSELAAAFSSMAAQLRVTFASLQTKEQRLREALEAAQMGTWEWNIPQHTVTWSAQVAPLYGLPPGEQSGPPEAFLAMIHPDDRQALTAQVTACLAQHRTSFAVEYRTRWPDGSLHWLEGTGQIWHDDNHQPLHLRGTVTEVTARKAADAALRESQERYRIISELVSSYAYAYRCDPDGGLALEWITDAFTQITGHSSARLGTMAAWDAVISDADRARVQRHRAQILAGAEPEMVEYAIVAGDGRPIWLREYHRPMWDEPAGRIVRLYGAAQDITRFKQLERQLQQSQKMEAVGRLSGGIAHDFNNLLTVILGHCALARLDIAPEHPLWSDITLIQDAAERAAMLTHQLLAFSRQQVLQPQVVAVNTIVTAMGQLLQRLIGEDITLVLRLDPTVSTIMADPGQLQQVIMNLAINARDAMPAGGTLTIETSEMWRDGLRWVQLSVQDTGIGMDPATQAHIFEPFFTTKEIGKGTGLGLATVHGIVLQSRGQISMASTVGYGTTFRIALPPSASAESGPAADGAPEHPPHGAGTILLVEDEDPVRALIARVLRTHGYAIIEARNGAQALDLMAVNDQPIDLLLTDMRMPGGLSGQQLAARLQGMRAELKVLYISGYTDTMPCQEAADPNCGWLHKPFTPDALVRTVAGMLQRR